MYSVINLFHRDDLDLLDDLIHENGHHYLNLHLNLASLIEEDDQKIFYSPWRESLRPVRGIYHAYCTFAWAFKLYSDLYEQRDQFTEAEQQKISRRMLEEYYMLDYAYFDLLVALDMGKISKEGKVVFEDFKKEFIDTRVELISKAQSSLDNESSEKVTSLINTLEEERKRNTI